MDIKYVILDLGGVLVKIEPDNFYKKMFQITGININILKDIKNDITLGLITPEEAFEKVIKNYKLKISLKEIIDSFVYDYIGNKIDGVDEFLSRLKDLDIKIGLLSNTNKLHFDYIKKLFNDFRIFDKIYLSYELNLAKPDKRIYEYVLNDLKIPASEIIFIDDTDENIKTALDLGFKAIKVKKNIVNFNEILENYIF
jgi:putative hydrolase of the HAD superfamily